MRFESPLILLALALAPLLYLLIRKREKPVTVNFPFSIPDSVATRDPSRILLGLRLAAIAIAIVAFARPQNRFQSLDRTVSGVDIVLVMDVSASMNIEDLGDRSRFEIAKDTLTSFVRARQNDRIGFLIFSGEPLALVPPTLDYGVVLKAIRDTEIGLLKDGTAIGDGLAVAVGHLRNSTAKSRIIILLTDGDNNVGQLDPGTSGELAAGYGIKVYTIAIGREGRVKLPIRQKTPFGNTITTYQWMNNALNPQLLEEIAKLTGAKFYRVTEEDSLTKVFKEIDRLEKTEIKTHEKIRYEEDFQKPLFMALLVLMLELVLAATWLRRVP